MNPPPPRVQSLDLIRGVAVLGIIAVNVAGFAGPSALIHSPQVLGPASTWGLMTHTIMLVVFEGKMRTLFSILFGASLLLFVERREQRGQDGQILQLRRLFWLALLGYLHFVFLWRGDILFHYACAGVFALALRPLATPGLIAAALFMFTSWQGWETARHWPLVRAEHHAAQGLASDTEKALLAKRAEAVTKRSHRELREYRMGFIDQAEWKLHRDPWQPLRIMVFSLGETVPFMLIGMALLRSGFLSGQWSRKGLRTLAMIGIGLGGVMSLGFASWAVAQHFPEATMEMMVMYTLGYPHLLMALGYAAVLVMIAPAVLRTGIGRALEAAGRMALSNYIATSVLMAVVFHGWGLSLTGLVPIEHLPAFVLLAWLMILGWSKPWLARFNQGPLEWLWRSLTEGRLLPFRR